MSLSPGESLAIVGPAASGKSRLIRCLRGLDKTGQGAVHVSDRPAAAGRESFSKRSKPQTIVRHALKGKKSGHAAEAISACGLWDLKLSPLSSFSSSQLAACQLLPCLAQESRLLLIDGQLDRLDPWTLASVFEELRKRLSSGAALVAATNRPELLPQFDSVIVLDRFHVVFAGRVDSLLKHGPDTEFAVGSQLQRGVRALVEPFHISVHEEGERVTFRASHGQELAAKLLLEGYGDVEYVVTRTATPEQALMHLTKSRQKRLRK